MSRRCDREGVEWDDRCTLWERTLMFAGYAPDMLWDIAEWRAMVGPPRARHAELMAHLRERPVLPPWRTVQDIARELAEAAAVLRAAHESDDDDTEAVRRYNRARFAAGERCICDRAGDPDARHRLACATADVGPLHCVLYRDGEGRCEVHVYTRGAGSWSSRWVGALRVTGTTAPLDALAKALAWARREVRR